MDKIVSDVNMDLDEARHRPISQHFVGAERISPQELEKLGINT